MYSESNMYLKVLYLCTVNQICTWKCYSYVQWIKYVLENVIVKNSDFPYDSWKVILAFKQTTIPCWMVVYRQSLLYPISPLLL